MATIVMKGQVEDFDAWLEVFQRNTDFRVSHGATGHRVYRDGNTVVVLVEFPAPDAGAAFLADPELQTRMKEAGVVGQPDTAVVTEVDVRGY